MKPDLGTFTNALSCAGLDTPSHFFWKQPWLVSLLFQDFSLGQRLFKFFFLSHQSNKEVQLNIFEGPKTKKQKTRGTH